jgi:hypothetical protein
VVVVVEQAEAAADLIGERAEGVVQDAADRPVGLHDDQSGLLHVLVGWVDCNRGFPPDLRRDRQSTAIQVLTWPREAHGSSQ